MSSHEARRVLDRPHEPAVRGAVKIEAVERDEPLVRFSEDAAWDHQAHERRHRAPAALVASGRFKYRETIAQGIESAPEAFIGLLKGKNFGKQLVKLI